MTTQCGERAHPGPEVSVADRWSCAVPFTVYNGLGASAQSGWKKNADVTGIRKICGNQIANVPPLTGKTRKNDR